MYEKTADVQPSYYRTSDTGSSAYMSSGLNSEQQQQGYNMNMGVQQKQVEIQRIPQKQGGYTEAEINVLKGKGNEERPE